MTPNPIILNHNSSADTSSDGEEEEYEVQHGGGPPWDDDLDEESESESEEEEEEEEEDDDDGSWDPLNDIIAAGGGHSGHRSHIDPAESASQSRNPYATSGARGFSSGKQPVGRGKVPRRPPKVPSVPDPPPGSPPRRSRPRRSHSARPQSVIDGHHDDYPYGGGQGRGGGELPYHPAAQWSGVGMHGGIPSTTSGFDSNPYALDQYQQRDPFSPYGQPSSNPFTQPPDQQQYYQQRRNRTSMPYGGPPPPPPQGGGSEMMRYGGYGGGGYHQQYQGYPPPPPGYPFPYPGMPPHHSPSPHNSKKSTPAPPPPPPPAELPPPPAKTPEADPGLKAIQDYILSQEKARVDKAAARQKERDDARNAAASAAKASEESKLDALQKLILEHNKAQLQREKERLEEIAGEMKKKEAAEQAAAEAKKAQSEKDKEVKAAAEKAKLEAEKKATEEAAKKKEEFDKEIEEIKKKAAEFEEAKKKAEAEAASLKPGDDMLKPPIRFKDAVGRKFSFPWHLCKTWKGMEGLIHQAFLHVEPIGQHVHDGHFDLIGPDGEIILPQVWETMVKPDWAIVMQMWPMPERKPPPLPPMPPLPPPPHMFGRSHSNKEKKSGKKDKHHIPMPPPPLPPPPPGMHGGHGGMPPPPLPPPPPGARPFDGSFGHPPPPPGIFPVPMAAPKEKKKKKAAPTGFLSWTAGRRTTEPSLKSVKKPESVTGNPKHKVASPANAASVENGKPARPSAPNGKSEKGKPASWRLSSIF